MNQDDESSQLRQLEETKERKLNPSPAPLSDPPLANLCESILLTVASVKGKRGEQLLVKENVKPLNLGWVIYFFYFYFLVCLFVSFRNTQYTGVLVTRDRSETSLLNKVQPPGPKTLPSTVSQRLA